MQTSNVYLSGNEYLLFRIFIRIIFGLIPIFVGGLAFYKLIFTNNFVIEFKIPLLIFGGFICLFGIGIMLQNSKDLGNG